VTMSKFFTATDDAYRLFKALNKPIIALIKSCYNKLVNPNVTAI